MWDISSSIRDGTCTLCIGRWNLNCKTAREVPKYLLKGWMNVLNALRHFFWNSTLWCDAGEASTHCCCSLHHQASRVGPTTPSSEWYNFTLPGGFITTEPSGKPAWCDSRNSTPSSPQCILPLEMNSISKQLLLKMQILLQVSILGLAKKNSIICWQVANRSYKEETQDGISGWCQNRCGAGGRSELKRDGTLCLLPNFV